MIQLGEKGEELGKGSGYDMIFSGYINADEYTHNIQKVLVHSFSPKFNCGLFISSLPPGVGRDGG